VAEVIGAAEILILPTVALPSVFVLSRIHALIHWGCGGITLRLKFVASGAAFAAQANAGGGAHIDEIISFSFSGAVLSEC
jgi:hypothetical protein